jgi:phage baseplate assembly protein V
MLTTMIRGLVTACAEGAIKRFSCTGRADETISDREYFQHYGFTSRPLAGAEAILINAGNHFIMVASDDRRYRIGVEGGEVCIYTCEGDRIHFKKDKEIYIKSGNKLVAEIENDVVVSTKRLDAHATESATLRSPLITLKADAITMETYSGGTPEATLRGNLNIEGDIVQTGDLTQTGSITSSGSIVDGGGNTNHHSH